MMYHRFRGAHALTAWDAYRANKTHFPPAEREYARSLEPPDEIFLSVAPEGAADPTRNGY